MWLLMLLGAVFAVYYWPATVFIVGCYLAHKGLEWAWGTNTRREAWKSLKRKMTARHEARRRLRENADLQNRLFHEGKLGGIYGDYPVPGECEGMGVWMGGSGDAYRRRDC